MSIFMKKYLFCNVWFREIESNLNEVCEQKEKNDYLIILFIRNKKLFLPQNGSSILMEIYR